jgi:hypothetical protein
MIFAPPIACKRDVGGVLGVKDSMVAHVLGKGGSNPCPNASAAARNAARTVRKKGKGKRELEEVSTDNDVDNDQKSKPAKKKLLTKIERSFTQSQLKVFRGIQVPFNSEQAEIVCEQFLRATISANLPFRWVEDPEVVSLFLLFRSTATDVIPSRHQMSGQLLNRANDNVTGRQKVLLRGQYAVLTADRWKDESRNAVNGVNLSINGKVKFCLNNGTLKTYHLPIKTYLVDLILANSHKKDGVSMCEAFEGMIDKAEDTYGVIVISLCCDNDGGSQRGRKNVVLRRPWLFGPPCCGHQVTSYSHRIWRRDNHIISSNSYWEIISLKMRRRKKQLKKQLNLLDGFLIMAEFGQFLTRPKLSSQSPKGRSSHF